ncbi:MFS transporter [Paenibacillus glufosinatiresistens]|uniref:MFS transporter n=1 Tax=Paenibacillus glufosinatiresistens TaxID=3070657 RepID=UPI00286E6AB6|nr:MFS transporter [Paenibacillus sp. YX.27]
MSHSDLNGDKLWSRSFLSICLCSFFVFITFYILAVTLPAYALDELGGDKNSVGLVTTVFVVAAVIFRPLAGRWLDEISRRKLVLASLALFGACSLLYLLVPGYTALLALRFVHGIAFGVAATSTSAIVLDLIPNRRKGEGIGYFTLFMSLAMVIGPFLGLSISEHAGYRPLFVFIGAAGMLSLLCGLLIPIPPRAPRPQGENLGRGLLRYFEPKALPISLAGFFLAFAYGALSTFISVYAASIGLTSAASYFFIVFAAMVLLSRPFTGRLYDRRGAHLLVYPGAVLFAAGMLALSAAHSAFGFLLTAALIGLGYGAILPSFQTLAVQSAAPHRGALATSTYFVLFDLGFGLGSFLLGLQAAHTGYRTMYVTGGLIAMLSVSSYFLLHHRRQSSAALKAADPVRQD